MTNAPKNYMFYVMLGARSERAGNKANRGGACYRFRPVGHFDLGLGLQPLRL
ncbi:hypothetical protein ACP179_06500 [Xenorhabdus stockiae]|uniref:hypothetical protein n=1 Tax=Xenorhabdus stockiae TaxID=351614 RepID=UPI003CEFE02E